MELWKRHKSALKQNFNRLVKQIKAQQRGEQGTRADQRGRPRSEKPQPVAGHNMSLSDGNEEGNGSHHCALSASSAPPNATNSHRPVLKRLAAIVASIKSELDLPSATSIPDTIAMAMSSLGLAVVGTMTLKHKAAQVAHELDIPIVESEAQIEE